MIMKGEEERTTERLREMRLRDPDPSLRDRTMRAVREELSREREPTGWRPWLARWRVELALTAGIAVCLALIPMLNGLTVSDGRDADAVRMAEVERVVDELNINGGLEPYIRFRVAAAERARQPEGRTSYFEKQRELADWNL